MLGFSIQIINDQLESLVCGLEETILAPCERLDVGKRRPFHVSVEFFNICSTDARHVIFEFLHMVTSSGFSFAVYCNIISDKEKGENLTALKFMG